MASEISHHISKLMSVIHTLFLEAHPLVHFPIDKWYRIATFLHQHNYAHAQVTVAVHELELQPPLHAMHAPTVEWAVFMGNYRYVFNILPNPRG